MNVLARFVYKCELYRKGEDIINNHTKTVIREAGNGGSLRLICWAEDM